MVSDYQSVRFHLSYPRQAAVLTWDECACLAKSLGYRDSSLQHCYLQAIDVKYAADGFQLSQLDTFLGSKFFKSGFDFTYNSHSCEWNEQAVRRAFAVTAGRGMTFQQLYTTRIAYGLYESSDLRGLKAKPRTVMRALKACGRAISLGKMSHRVRHMRFHEPGRLQLDEFIDLALWAGPLDREEARCALRQAEGPHEMVSFEEMLTPIDERIQHRLDAEYRREERQYIRETVRPEDKQLRQCAVQTFRENRLMRSREIRDAFEPLRQALKESATGVGSRSRATSRATSAIQGRDVANWMDTDTDEDDRIVDGGTRFADFSDEATTRAGSVTTKMSPRRRPATSCSLIRSTPTIVTQSDLSRTELLRDALAFQTEALPELHARRIAEDIETLRPGFEQRHADRQKAATAAAAELHRVAQDKMLAAEAATARLARLERHQRRQARLKELAIRTEPAQLPSHGLACDASSRSVDSDGGQLTAPHYEPSYQGRLFQRLDETDANQVRRFRGKRVGSAAFESRLRHQQQKSRPSKEFPATSKADITDRDAHELQWLEPHLGLTLPLASTACRVSRLSYSRSCPPRAHPVGKLTRETTYASDETVAATVQLIQRAVYAANA